MLALLLLLTAASCSTVGVHGSAAPKYDENLMAKRLNRTIDFCTSNNNETCATLWIDKFGKSADYFANIINRFNFAYSNRMEDKLSEQLLTLSNRVEVWSLRNLRIARRFQWRSFHNATLKRRFKALTLDPTLENETDRLQLSELHQSLQNSYSHIAACPKLGNNSAAGCLPVGEQAVSDVLANASASYDYKLSVWRSWYDSAAGAMATNFTAYVRLANSSARQIGYGDFGEADWRSDFESDSFNSDVLAWYAQLSDLYTQLHAYVRHRLSRRYPGKFRPDGCLPAHILGHDQWAQQWSLQSEDFPRRVTAVNYTDLLVRKFGNFTELVRAAEGFYKSLGMPAMTKEFWQRSDFFKPANSSIVKDCHASAWEFANRKDFRIKMCGRVRVEDFNVIHHEMGHIEYFMAYSRQPREFRNSANSGFHEAVGDTMSLSVNTRAHFATLGMLPNGTEAAEAELNRLFSMALEKVAFLPFALTTGVFRWLVFNGTAGPDTYNRVWWGLRARYGGICPPVDRPSGGFDAGAKYHVAQDISYIRYYFSFILQFQLHRRMCQLSGHKGPVNRCDFYRSKKAGKKFLQMLKSGSSRPWQETLREFTKEDGLQTSALLEYFRPLHAWLADYNKRHGVPVGWKVPKDVLKGVSS
ncbi:hypothetical protein BOX15_Mlig032609g2 [Macrostomum lignano]|uniref:Angiotensin-converting enzyme n=1 Tax=Macrostomum lignano TaxID=282301 RepID=A0A267FS60_9PLAT|nr:hypothetical protein BOX15_Mlig032609g2 [Macrostomum lignano]